MKSFSRLMLVALGAAGMGGCTVTGTISAIPQNKVTATQSGGKTWLVSVRKNTVAVCTLTPTYKTHAKDLLIPAFMVAVRNGGAEGISLSFDDVTASVDGRTLHRLTYDECCQEVIARGDREIATIKAAIGNMWSPLDVSQRDQSMAENAATGFQAMWAFSEQGQTRIMQLGQRREALLAEAKSIMGPSPYPIAPGQAIRRVILFRPSELSAGHQLHIRVTVGGETHEFAFNLDS